MKRHMANRRRRLRGTTIAELAVAMSIGMIVLLTGWVTVEMSHRETNMALTRTEVSRNVYNVLRSIEDNVLRAETIQIPDPDYPSLDSMQVLVPDGAGGTLRRAFRREGTWLVVDWKDESDAPYHAFSGVTSLTFNALDAPTNSLIEIGCTVTIEGESIHMRSVARKRN